MTAPEMTNPFQDVDITSAVHMVSDGSESVPPVTPPADEPATPVVPAPSEEPGETPESEPSGIELGELGTFTTDELSEMLGELRDFREKSQPRPQESQSPENLRREQDLKEAMDFWRAVKDDPEAAKAIEPFLQKREESRLRDPSTGQFRPQTDAERYDPRLSDDFIRQAQEDHQFVEEQRENSRLQQVDASWDAFKAKPELSGLIDEKFEKAVAAKANAITDRTGRYVTGDDLITIAKNMLFDSGALIEHGKRQVLAELKTKPAGTTVLTGAGGNDLPSPPEKDFKLDDLGKALLEAGAIR